MKTLFVAGAGASADFDLPVGASLQRDISKFVNPRVNTSDRGNIELERISSLIEDRGVPYQQQFELFEWMSRTLPLASSIDSFLEKQSVGGDAISFLGKYAIASLVSSSEKKSPLFVERRAHPNFEKLYDSWLGRLFPLINKGGAANIDEKGLDEFAFLFLIMTAVLSSFCTLHSNIIIVCRTIRQ